MNTAFRSAEGLTIRVADTDGPVFDAFYQGYDKAFTLPNEKEERAGFLECLELNRGDRFERLTARFGRFRELVMVAELDGELVGGANMIVTRIADRSVTTVNLNYIYVLPGRRGGGLLRRLVGACREIIARLFADSASPLMFLELNDPLLLTAEQYEQDTAISGIDQFDRVVIWARLGVRIVDFPYVQPPLSATQQADSNLLLGLLAGPSVRLDGPLLADHLERFFAISVLKTGDVATNGTAGQQVRDCRELGEIALLDPLPVLDSVRGAVGSGGPGLRERLRA